MRPVAMNVSVVCAVTVDSHLRTPDPQIIGDVSGGDSGVGNLKVIDVGQITEGKTIGSGNFGDVKQGVWHKVMAQTMVSP